MSSYNECQELKNIKYKTMLQNHTNINEKTESNITNMDEILDKERETSNLLPWSKLENFTKIEKLNDYVDRYIEINNMNKTDNKKLKDFLKDALEKKRLKISKEITYDKTTGIIKNIPSLHFNSDTKEFTLKNVDDKKTRTSLGLAPKNRKTKKNTNDKRSSRKHISDKSKSDKSKSDKSK